MTRQSSLAQIFIKVRVGHDDCLLLMRHDKWGDWSLVGGHVEHGEEGDLLREPITWGLEKSRSAGGKPTVYTAQFFALRLLVPADEALSRLDATRVVLVPQARLNASNAKGRHRDTTRRRPPIPAG
jgi:8-oxo-dGTP pyrophosphatase MutT (NUDIX family)